ncbi:hypothetical protein T05_12488, partial [Trichinella murrelli]
MEDEKLSSCILRKISSNSSIFMYPVAFNNEDTVDHVSLYLTPFAFGAPTGGNAPCSNMFVLRHINAYVSNKRPLKFPCAYLNTQERSRN